MQEVTVYALCELTVAAAHQFRTSSQHPTTTAPPLDQVYSHSAFGGGAFLHLYNTPRRLWSR